MTANNEQSQNLDRVAEISNIAVSDPSQTIDAAKASKAVEDFLNKKKSRIEMENQREAELAKIKVDETVVKKLAADFEIPPGCVRRRLREMANDVDGTVRSFVDQSEPLPLRSEEMNLAENYVFEFEGV